MIWTHPAGLAVEMEFDGAGWLCRCEGVGEMLIRNQAAEDMEMMLNDWIADQLAAQAQAAGEGEPPKTIWEKVIELVEGGGLIIAPKGRLTIWESESDHSVSLFHDRSGGLRLIGKNGPVKMSGVLAQNPARAAANVWRLVEGARGVYDAWAAGVRGRE